MSIQPPPIYEILSGEDGKPKLPWIVFFNSVYNGDAGLNWTPNFESLGVSGTPTITGRYYRLSQYLVFFRVTVIPDTNTTSTAGTTYIDNFPLVFSADGACIAVSGNLGATPGHIVASNNRIYTPGWTAATVPVTVLGIGEAG